MDYASAVPSAGGNLELRTSEYGTVWVPFDDQPCCQLTLINNTGVDLVMRQDGGGAAMPITSGQPYTIYGITNANQIAICRADQSTAQVTVPARWEN